MKAPNLNPAFEAAVKRMLARPPQPKPATNRKKQPKKKPRNGR